MRCPYTEAQADEYRLVRVDDGLGLRYLVMRHLFATPTPFRVLAVGTRDACQAAKRLLEDT